jgi:pentatricopeptide repeat protein
MISVYGHRGEWKPALSMFAEMEGAGIKVGR